MPLTNAESRKTQSQPFEFTFGPNTMEPKADFEANFDSRLTTFAESGTVPKHLRKQPMWKAQALDLEVRRDAAKRNARATIHLLHEKLQEFEEDIDARTALRTLKSENEATKKQLAEAQAELATVREARALMAAKHTSEVALLKERLEQARRESEGRKLEMWALEDRNRLVLKEMAVQKASMSERLSQELTRSFEREIKHCDLVGLKVLSATEDLRKAEAKITPLIKELLVAQEQATEVQEKTMSAISSDPAERMALVKRSNGRVAAAAAGVVEKYSTPQQFSRSGMDFRIFLDRWSYFPRNEIVIEEVVPGMPSPKSVRMSVQDAIELQKALPDVIRAARLLAEDMDDF